MPAPESLKDLYTGELQDLWSANDQMARVLKKISKKVSDEKLREMLDKSQEGIAQHTETLKQLIVDAGEKAKKEHCKGMEGLVEEAVKHTSEEAPEKGPLLDAQIIAQYQRMTHYGLAGFGTAMAFAEALGEVEAGKTLKKMTAEIYGGDEYATKLAETVVNIDAAEEEDA